MGHTRNRKQRAFTITELLVIVGWVGVLATIGVASFNHIHFSVKTQKLKNDQATLNGSINVFRGFGGDVSGIEDAEEVILKMKKVALASEKKTIPGLSGSMLDPRVTLDWQNDEQAMGNEPRLHWNPATMNFDLATSGPPGIRRIILDENVSHVPGQEGRDFIFSYADNSTWIWDFENEQRQSWLSPTVFQVDPEPVSALPEGSSIDNAEAIPNPGTAELTLQPPTLSHDSGAYSIREYGLPVEIFNPNPEDSSKIYYSVDYGSWSRYGGPLALDPDATIQTMAVANEVAEYNNSSMVTADYSATPVTLNPPAIQVGFDAFGLFSEHEIGVTITDPNITDPSALEYRIDDGSWVAYNGPFNVTRQDYPDGLVVDSRAVAAEGPYSEYYNESPIESRTIGIDAFTLSASSEADFHDPFGGPEMLTNINQDQRKPKMMWGNQFNDEGVKMPGQAQSWLEFTGSESVASVGQRVELGTLDFYNGSHGAQTGADGVALEVRMALNVSGMPFDLVLDFDFILNNVPNDENANSSDHDLAIVSADYMKMAPSSKVTELEVNGFYYQFILEFGDVEGNGFVNFDEFHVLETQSATTKLYGTFNAVSATEYESATNP